MPSESTPLIRPVQDGTPSSFPDDHGNQMFKTPQANRTRPYTTDSGASTESTVSSNFSPEGQGTPRVSDPQVLSPTTAVRVVEAEEEGTTTTNPYPDYPYEDWKTDPYKLLFYYGSPIVGVVTGVASHASIIGIVAGFNTALLAVLLAGQHVAQRQAMRKAREREETIVSVTQMLYAQLADVTPEEMPGKIEEMKVVCGGYNSPRWKRWVPLLPPNAKQYLKDHNM